MKKAPTPAEEFTRLETLRALKILDTDQHGEFDRITRLAKPLFNVPISLVSLVDEDRQWFLSRVGLDAPETPRDISFCGHAIMKSEIFVVNDAALDPNFRSNPLVTGNPFIRFYAGYPIRTVNGSRIGTFCIIDTKPREFSDADAAIMANLAKLVERELAGYDISVNDKLTNLPNKRGFLALSLQSVHQESVKSGAIVAIKITNMAQVNFNLGPIDGDLALINFGKILSDSVKKGDVLARTRGTQFGLFLSNTTASDADKLMLSLKVFAASEHPLTAKDAGNRLQFDYGIASFDGTDNINVETLYNSSFEQIVTS